MANGQLSNAAQFQDIIIAYRNGAPVRVRDIGRAVDSVQNDKVAAWYNGKRCVLLAIQRQPGTNTIDVVDQIKRLLPQFRAQVPAGIKIDILYDRSHSIRQSVDDVQITLITAFVLVVLIIFLFLRNLSATVIPASALPLSLSAPSP